MKTLVQNLPIVVVAVLSAALIVTPSAFPQDPSQIAVQNAQQASQQAAQAAQQASSEAQQANQQALQAAQHAQQNADSAALQGAVPKQPTPIAFPPSSAVPLQIPQAHKVFLTNAGADHNFPVDENTAYNAVLTAFRSWGHYQFVSSPTEADLIFSLHDAAPITDITGDARGTYTISSPAFLLTIVDAHTNTTLWTVTSPVISFGSGKKEALWFALSVNNLVTRVKVLAGQPLTLEEQANLTTFPKSHDVRVLAIVLGSAAVLAVGAVLIGEHISSNWAANAKAQQDAFCKANNIPLSMCAGG